MKEMKLSRRALFGVGAGTVAGSAAVLALWPKLIGYFLGAAILCGVVWIGSHFLVRALRRRKQHKFDAGVAAREGIEDRKREWSSWTKELEQQGIDRYELPFYLLVGEPQSGKSVLLQNSDLSFPFGQNRLSGIGGTRGCDWWFTEEAVILDLAGRLFTHEGGDSDEAEWEAFLGLLASYRPQCPANGLMLVIPCDSLLRDNRDDANRKANKIQNALLTLSKQLQAQLPIYVILTKADRIFGFAETVHRLDAEQRQQMFGWSRSSEDVAAPFDMVEVRSAFAGVVGRARVLRDTMMSSLRLPEGVPEVDRMYAFPDELEAVGPNLEIYLKRIFSESSLVDRLYFRGFYLTSGLQTGTPIANVCAELFGATGEADRRDLSALFTKQHAYFIKDLVRRRVFSERGLVRPTETRVARSRRNAYLGYGVAAAIAVVAVALSIAYVLGGYDKSDLSRFHTAITRSAEVANTAEPSAVAVLSAMEAVWQARAVKELNLESAGISRTGPFIELYCKLCDRVLLPRLRSTAEIRVHELLKKDPEDHATFLRRADQVRLLLAGFDPGDAGQMAILAELFVADVTGWEQALDRRRELIGDVKLALSTHESGRSATNDAALADAARRVSEAFDRTLMGGDALQIRGPAGYVVAWKQVDESFGFLEKIDPAKIDPDRHDLLRQHIRDYHRAGSYLIDPRSKDELTLAEDKRWRLPRNAVEAALDALAARRTSFLAAEGLPAGSPWPRREELRRFMDGAGVFGKTAAPATGDPAAAASNLLEGPRIDVPGAELAAHLSPVLIAVCAPDRLGFDESEAVHGVAADRAAIDRAAIERAAPALSGARVEVKAAADGLALRVLAARMLLVQDDIYLPSIQDWPSLLRAIDSTAEAGTPARRTAMVLGMQHLGAMRVALRDLAPPSAKTLFQPLDRRLTSMVGVGLRDIESQLPGFGEGSPARVDTGLLRALAAVRETPGDDATRALEVTRGHLRQVEESLLRGWDQSAANPAETTARILRELDEHQTALLDFGADKEVGVVLEGWINSSVRPLMDKRRDVHGAEILARRPLPKIDGELQAIARETAAWLRRPDDKPSGWLEELPAEFDVEAVRHSIAEIAARQPPLEAVVLLGSIGARKTGLDAYFQTSPRAARLRTAVDELAAIAGSGDEPQRGPKLAGLLAKQFATPSSEPVEYVTDWYLDRLREAIAMRITVEVRRRYEKDLRDRLGRLNGLQWVFSRGAEGIADYDTRRKAIAVDLVGFFGPRGDYESQASAYALDLDAAPGTDFRPLSGSAEFVAFWRFDTFLRDLRAFFRAGDPARTLDDASTKITLEPQEIGTGAWGVGFGFNCVFTTFETGNDKHYFDLSVLDEQKRFGPLTWKFGGAALEDLEVRWSKSPVRPQSDDVEIKFASVLAPLALAWFRGSPVESGSASSRFDVDHLFATPPGMHAKFRLVFDRPLPLFVLLP